MKRVPVLLVILVLCLSTSVFAQHINVTSPTGGALTMGEQTTIEWNATGVTGPLIVALHRNGVRVGAIADNLNPQVTSVPWKIGDYRGGTVATGEGYSIVVKQMGAPIKGESPRFRLVVRITQVGGTQPTPGTQTPGGFGLPQAQPEIVVIAPKGPGGLNRGVDTRISWQGPFVTRPLKIILKRNGTRVGVIAENVPNGSSPFPWKAGEYQGGMAEGGNGYTIVVKTMDNSLIGESPSPFSLYTYSLVGDLPTATLAPPGGTIPTVTVHPHITGMMPGGGPGGTHVEISGNMLLPLGQAVPGEWRLWMQDSRGLSLFMATQSWTNSAIRGTSPPSMKGEGIYKIYIGDKRGNKLSNEIDYRLIVKGNITEAVPNPAPPGWEITVRGTGLGSAENGKAVGLNRGPGTGFFETVAWTDNRAVVKIPDWMSWGAGDLFVQLSPHIDVTNKIPFTVGSWIDRLDRNSGPFQYGTHLVLHGRFTARQGSQEVTFRDSGGLHRMTIMLWSPEIISAKFDHSPPPGTHDVYILDGSKVSNALNVTVTAH